MTETTQRVSASSRTGSIYDLGYRRYEGPRLGRGYAIRALALDSLRTAYGIGHGGRAKIAPIVFGAIAILPAVIVVGFLALASRLGARGQLERASPITYDTYYSSISAVIALFGSLSMAVSAFTPRRAYAIAGIIALFLVPGVVSGIVIGLGSGGLGSVLVLLSPGTILDGTASLFFGKDLPEQLFFFDLPRWTFLASAIVVTAIAGLLVVRRFLRYSA